MLSKKLEIDYELEIVEYESTISNSQSQMVWFAPKCGSPASLFVFERELSCSKTQQKAD